MVRSKRSRWLAVRSIGITARTSIRREQLTPKLVEIGQGKHSLRSRQVLGQTAISHFDEPPQLLDYPKGVFAARAGIRERARLIIRQRWLSGLRLGRRLIR